MTLPAPSTFVSWLRLQLSGLPSAAALAHIVGTGAAPAVQGVTCRGKTDGGGAQVHAVISALAIARATRLTYFHSPFSSIAHAEGDEAEWADKWEAFFNLGQNERRLGANNVPRCVSIKRFLKSPSLWRGESLIIEAEHFTGYTDANVEALKAVLPDIRRKYGSTDKSGFMLHRLIGTLTMNVHVRRGDVSVDHPSHSDRFTHDEDILGIIRMVRKAAASEGLSVTVNIWSQGQHTDFAAYEAEDCHLYLDADIFETFHNLSQSDILLMAKSSLSYVAALLCDGICLYEEFWHAPLPEWIQFDLRDPLNSKALLPGLRRMADSIN